LSRFASRSFREVLAVLLFVCWTGDVIALALVQPRSLPESVAFVVSLWILMIGMAVCVNSREEPEPDEDAGDGPGGNGGGWDGPPRRPGPSSGPDWWPKFERDFRAYVGARQQRSPEERRVPIRTGLVEAISAN
jgi:hypothetical protein